MSFSCACHAVETLSLFLSLSLSLSLFCQGEMSLVVIALQVVLSVPVGCLVVACCCSQSSQYFSSGHGLGRALLPTGLET